MIYCNNGTIDRYILLYVYTSVKGTDDPTNKFEILT